MAKPFAILSHCQKNGYDIYNCLKKTAATLPEGPVDERKVLSVINIYVHTSCSEVVILRTRPKASHILSDVNNHGNLPFALSLRLLG